ARGPAGAVPEHVGRHAGEGVAHLLLQLAQDGPSHAVAAATLHETVVSLAADHFRIEGDVGPRPGGNVRLGRGRQPNRAQKAAAQSGASQKTACASKKSSPSDTRVPSFLTLHASTSDGPDGSQSRPLESEGTAAGAVERWAGSGEERYRRWWQRSAGE